MKFKFVYILLILSVMLACTGDNSSAYNEDHIFAPYIVSDYQLDSLDLELNKSTLLKIKNPSYAKVYFQLGAHSYMDIHIEEVKSLEKLNDEIISIEENYPPSKSLKEGPWVNIRKIWFFDDANGDGVLLKDDIITKDFQKATLRLKENLLSWDSLRNIIYTVDNDSDLAFLNYQINQKTKQLKLFDFEFDYAKYFSDEPSLLAFLYESIFLPNKWETFARHRGLQINLESECFVIDSVEYCEANILSRINPIEIDKTNFLKLMSLYLEADSLNGDLKKLKSSLNKHLVDTKEKDWVFASSPNDFILYINNDLDKIDFQDVLSHGGFKFDKFSQDLGYRQFNCKQYNCTESLTHLFKLNWINSWDDMYEPQAKIDYSKKGTEIANPYDPNKLSKVYMRNNIDFTLEKKDYWWIYVDQDFSKLIDIAPYVGWLKLKSFEDFVDGDTLWFSAFDEFWIEPILTPSDLYKLNVHNFNNKALSFLPNEFIENHEINEDEFQFEINPDFDSIQVLFDGFNGETFWFKNDLLQIQSKSNSTHKGHWINDSFWKSKDSQIELHIQRSGDNIKSYLLNYGVNYWFIPTSFWYESSLIISNNLTKPKLNTILNYNPINQAGCQPGSNIPTWLSLASENPKTAYYPLGIIPSELAKNANILIEFCSEYIRGSSVFYRFVDVNLEPISEFKETKELSKSFIIQEDIELNIPGEIFFIEFRFQENLIQDYNVQRVILKTE